MKNLKPNIDYGSLIKITLTDPDTEDAFYDDEIALVTFPIDDMFRQLPPAVQETSEALKIKSRIKFGNIEFEGVRINNFHDTDMEWLGSLLDQGRVKVYSKKENKYVDNILKGSNNLYFLPNKLCFYQGTTTMVDPPPGVSWPVKHNRFKDWFKTFLP